MNKDSDQTDVKDDTEDLYAEFVKKLKHPPIGCDRMPTGKEFKVLCDEAGALVQKNPTGELVIQLDPSRWDMNKLGLMVKETVEELMKKKENLQSKY